ncbi:MAG: zinc ribbon domain-containing protein [Lachnospiraceae bacterium]|nr:zinc ribbon domain-containing protein [Lachnospiraceae bacterium]
MTDVKFGTLEPIRYMAPDFDNTMVSYKVYGTILIEQDVEDAFKERIKSEVLSMIPIVFSEFHAREVKCLELPAMCSEMSKKLTERLREIGRKCNVNVGGVVMDEESKKIIEEKQRAKIIADNPAIAQVEQIRAMQAAGTVNRPKFCPNCGTPVGPTGKFCGNCGSPLGV